MSVPMLRTEITCDVGPIKKVKQRRTYGILPAMLTVGQMLENIQRDHHSFDLAKLSLQLLLSPTKPIPLHMDKTMWDVAALWTAHSLVGPPNI